MKPSTVKKKLIIFLFCLFHIEFLQGHFDKISGELKLNDLFVTR